jgi:putative component of membrane protein insertase Oxa1/YidC/SpoIIIJ protein YidD
VRVQAAALALAAIRFYQRFISPYKGFSCAPWRRRIRG